jgi:hypothetical protein
MHFKKGSHRGLEEKKQGSHREHRGHGGVKKLKEYAGLKSGVPRAILPGRHRGVSAFSFRDGAIPIFTGS